MNNSISERYAKHLVNTAVKETELKFESILNENDEKYRKNIIELTETINKRDKTISERNKTIIHRNKTIDECNKIIDERDKLITELRKCIDEKNNYISLLKTGGKNIFSIFRLN